MDYGNKRDYPKIDLYVWNGKEFAYRYSTTWSATCREAKLRLAKDLNLREDHVKASFSPDNPKRYYGWE